MGDQEQFLQVLDRDEAERRFRAVLDLTPRGVEHIVLTAALGRVLAADVVSPVDVPSFDRSNVDGYALQAADTFAASEQRPRLLRLVAEAIGTGVVPRIELAAGQAIEIATGAMLPRGADAVVMVEHTETAGGDLLVHRAVTPGANLSFTGTDIAAGELVLYPGEQLTRSKPKA